MRRMLELDKIDPKLRKRIEDQIANEDRIKRSRTGEHPRKEEQQEDHSETRNSDSDDHNRSKDSKDLPAHRSAFRVTINFRYSDRRRRDLTNSAETILDALITARRQLE